MSRATGHDVTQLALNGRWTAEEVGVKEPDGARNRAGDGIGDRQADRRTGSSHGDRARRG